MIGYVYFIFLTSILYIENISDGVMYEKLIISKELL